MEHKVCRMLDVFFLLDITDIIYDYSDGFKINTLEIKIEEGDYDYYYFNIKYNNCVVFMQDAEYIDEKFENFVNDLAKNKSHRLDLNNCDGAVDFIYDDKTNIYKQVALSFDGGSRGATYEVKLSKDERLLFAKKLSEMITIHKKKKPNSYLAD